MTTPNNAKWQKAVSATACKGYQLQVILENDEKLDLDLTPLITKREAFWRLKNYRYFRKVAIDPLGGLCWPEGEDISPGKISSYKTKIAHP